MAAVNYFTGFPESPELMSVLEENYPNNLKLLYELAVQKNNLINSQGFKAII